MAVTGAVVAAIAIAKVIDNINDKTKRRRFEQAVADLSNRQQQELGERLLKAQTETERLKILSDSIVEFAAANQASADKQKTIMFIIAGSLGVILMGIALIVVLKKKK